jgi:hypothetical protein
MRPSWIASIVVVALVVGIAAYSVVSVGSTASNSVASTLNVQSSSSLGSSSVYNTSSTSVQSSAVQQTSSDGQYSLVWAPNSPSGCYYDQYGFCVEAVLGFSDNATIAFTATSSTTIIEGNATTIIHYDTVNTTTILRTGTETVSCEAAGNATLGTNHTSSVSSTSCTSSVATYSENDVIVGPENGYSVTVFALVQNATTGQYITMGGGGSFVSGGCDLNPTGYTKCYAPGYLGEAWPGPLSYKVTVFITKGDELPCQLQEAGPSCSVPLLAPIQTITVTE